jgi:hypothetical protein
MGQNNFIKGLICEKLNLRAQFELNWEGWNFRRSYLILTKSIDWNQEKIARKLKFLDQLGAKLKKFTTNNHF